MIISVLSSVALFATNSSREQAKSIKALKELDSARDGMGLLFLDTGKYLFGCPSNKTIAWDNEVALSHPDSGMTVEPSPGTTASSVSPPCEWTAENISDWDGPYMPTAIDPWGNPYIYDSDYYPRGDCSLVYDLSAGGRCWNDGIASNNNNPLACRVLPIKAFVSEGPTKLNKGVLFGYYDCDDIYLQIQ